MNKSIQFQPETAMGLGQGIDLVVRAVRPTLGPISRTVVVGREAVDQPPAIMDNAGIIARRIIEIANPCENTGAMLVRNVVWRLYEDVGDGTATAAILFGALYKEGHQMRASGMNMMRMRSYFMRGLTACQDELSNMAMKVENLQQLVCLAESTCFDAQLADLLGEAQGTLGEFGRVDIRISQHQESSLEFIEGSVWEEGVLSHEILAKYNRNSAQIDLDNAHVLLSNLKIETPEELIPLLDMAYRAGFKKLIIFAEQISDKALSMLTSNIANTIQVIPVKVPGADTSNQLDALTDLAKITGSRPILKATGESLENLCLKDLGTVKRFWASKSHFGIVYDQDENGALHEHYSHLEKAYSQAQDPEKRKLILERLGRLLLSSAVVKVGGSSRVITEARKATAVRTLPILCSALNEGIVPGGGTALLRCIPRLLDMADDASELEEKTAYRILARALQEPARVLMQNAGIEPSVNITDVLNADACYGFDVRSNCIVDLMEAGILNSVAVEKAIIREAIAGAAMALTIDTIIYPKNREVSQVP